MSTPSLETHHSQQQLVSAGICPEASCRRDNEKFAGGGEKSANSDVSYPFIQHWMCKE
jgi:hypothetical protein